MLAHPGRLPAHHGVLAALHVNLEAERRVWSRGNAGCPGQMLSDGVVGVIQPELVPRPWQTPGEVDLLDDISRPQSGVGSGGTDGRPGTRYLLNIFSNKKYLHEQTVSNLNLTVNLHSKTERRRIINHRSKY